MTRPELLAKVKLNMFISTDAFDEELNNLIDAAENDISASCDSEFDITNKAECDLVVLYVKGLFGAGDDRSWNLYKERLAVIATRKVGTDEV